MRERSRWSNRLFPRPCHPLRARVLALPRSSIRHSRRCLRPVRRYPRPLRGSRQRVPRHESRGDPFPRRGPAPVRLHPRILSCLLVRSPPGATTAGAGVGRPTSFPWTPACRLLAPRDRLPRPERVARHGLERQPTRGTLHAAPAPHRPIPGRCRLRLGRGGLARRRRRHVVGQPELVGDGLPVSQALGAVWIVRHSFALSSWAGLASSKDQPPSITLRGCNPSFFSGSVEASSSILCAFY